MEVVTITIPNFLIYLLVGVLAIQAALETAKIILKFKIYKMTKLNNELLEVIKDVRKHVQKD